MQSKCVLWQPSSTTQKNATGTYSLHDCGGTATLRVQVANRMRQLSTKMGVRVELTRAHVYSAVSIFKLNHDRDPGYDQHACRLVTSIVPRHCHKTLRQIVANALEYMRTQDFSQQFLADSEKNHKPHHNRWPNLLQWLEKAIKATWSDCHSSSQSPGNLLQRLRKLLQLKIRTAYRTKEQQL